MKDGQYEGASVGVRENRTTAEAYPSRDSEVRAYAEKERMANCNASSPSPGGSFGGSVSERLSLDNIDDAMKYQPWQRDQFEAGDIVREALTAAAKAILRVVPDSPYRSVALRNVLDARMNANAAISFRGRF